MPLKILIIGAGVCGPALATLLTKAEGGSSHEITIIDRAPTLRTGGQQIDLRAQGITVVRRMGLLNAMRARAVPETGLAFVDRKGRVRASFPASEDSENALPNSLTSEYELMRGDIVEVFYRASMGLDPDGTGEDEEEKTIKNVRYVFGVTVTSLTETKDGSAVDVRFSDGRTEKYDLVVGADGQGSRTRSAVLGDASLSSSSDTCFRSLGLFSALYNIPRRADDPSAALAHGMPGRRSVMMRAGNRDLPAQIYLSFMIDPKSQKETPSLATAKTKGSGVQVSGESDSSSSSSNDENDEGSERRKKVVASRRDDETEAQYLRRIMLDRSVEAQKQLFISKFDGVDSWRVPEFVSYLQPEHSSAPPDFDPGFYATEIGQVHCPRLSRGRIVLLGDAGYCPSPITGMGTTLSLTGAYILAGELSSRSNIRVGGSDKEVDVLAALAAYEAKMRPYINKGQRLPPGAPGIVHPSSERGVWLLGAVVYVVSKLFPLLMPLLSLLPALGVAPHVPDYPELRLKKE